MMRDRIPERVVVSVFLITVLKHFLIAAAPPMVERWLRNAANEAARRDGETIFFDVTAPMQAAALFLTAFTFGTGVLGYFLYVEQTNRGTHPVAIFLLVLLIASAAAAAAVGAIEHTRSKLTLDAEGIIARNWRRTKRVRWCEIIGYSNFPSLGPRFHLRSGGVCSLGSASTLLRGFSEFETLLTARDVPIRR